MSTPMKQLLFTVVRLETTHADGTTGAATSFVFRDQASPPQSQLFLVSNKHVVEDALSAKLFFTPEDAAGAPMLGSPFHVENDHFAGQWHGHPNPDVDVSVMPLSWQLKLFAERGMRAHLRPISLDDVADPSIFENLDVSAPILFVGFPNGMFDEKHYLPIVRRGYVATSPELDFNGTPVFLIDASVFPGSSGSPVFTIGDSSVGGTPALKLLGIVSSVFQQRADGQLDWRDSPAALKAVPMFDQMIDLGKVFKVRCIRETITSFWSSQQSRKGN